MTQPVLTTKRLTLRSFTLQDSAIVQKLADNFNVSRYTLNIPHPYENGMAEEWINTHQEKWQQKSEFAYAMLLNENGALIGAIGLHEMNETEGELGYWIGEPYWGNGYCAEAAREIIRFSFSHFGLSRIKAQHVAENTASGKVLNKIGMNYIGCEMNRDRYGGKSKMEVYEIQNP